MHVRDAAKPAAKPDPVEIFEARCAARARLWAEGEFDLHEAVDILQFDAVRTGLVAQLGQDHVQHIIAVSFRAVRGRAALALVPDPSEPDDKPKRGLVAASTLWAAEYLVQQGDPDRLRRWLATHGAKERAAIRQHLEAKKCRS
jgi:hypothetical protein